MRDRVLKYLVALDHYPTWIEIIVHFGLIQADKTDTTLCELRDEGSIILDDSEIMVTAITNPKLQKLVDESVRIR